MKSNYVCELTREVIENIKDIEEALQNVAEQYPELNPYEVMDSFVLYIDGIRSGKTAWDIATKAFRQANEMIASL